MESLRSFILGPGGTILTILVVGGLYFLSTKIKNKNGLDMSGTVNKRKKRPSSKKRPRKK